MDTAIIAVTAGLAAGVAFIFLIHVILTPAPNTHFAGDVTQAERSLMIKAREEEAVQLFLKKYLYAQEGILNRESAIIYDDAGNVLGSTPAVTVIYRAPYPSTVVAYEDVKVNNHLIRYERPSLRIVIDMEGIVHEVNFFYFISYPDSISGMGSLVSGNDIVLKFLHAGELPC